MAQPYEDIAGEIEGRVDRDGDIVLRDGYEGIYVHRDELPGLIEWLQSKIRDAVVPG